jgi:two-component system, NarL family, response regulator NreC
MDGKINILIADDHYLIAKLLEEDLRNDANFNVVATAADGEQAIEDLEKYQVDVLLLDISMPKIDGMTVLKNVRNKYPKLKIIILSNLSNGWVIKKAIQMGANGYLTKFSTCNELSEAIYSVRNNNSYFCKTSFTNFVNVVSNYNDNSVPKDANSITSAIESDNNSKGSNNQIIDLLSVREKEILHMIVEGATTKEIAHKLFISTRTVESHRKNILQKLDVKNFISLMKVVLGNDVNEILID